MVFEETAIPPTRRVEVFDLIEASPTSGLVRERAMADDAGGPPTSLETARFGLLARPAAPIDRQRRMEDWIAGNLDIDIDIDPGVDPELAARGVWNRFIDRLPAQRRPPRRRRVASGPETAFADWSRFRIAYRRGITVVRLVDRDLVKEARVRQLERDLLDLIDAGNHRVILNFQVVERLGSWVALAVDRARQRCQSDAGGALKVCGLEPELAEVFPIAGVGRGLEKHPDEAAALESPWPEPAGPRTLPVEILLALTSATELPPLSGGAPIGTAGPDRSIAAPAPCAAAWHRRSDGRPAPADLVPISLFVQIGGHPGRAVSIASSRFLIGRERACHLRLGATMVSKQHAAIEQRDGQVFLRDLGSTNGSLVNGRLLRSQEAVLQDGDRIQIGPAVCVLRIEPPPAGGGPADPPDDGCLDHPVPAPVAVADPWPVQAASRVEGPAGLDEERADSEPEMLIQHEVIQDILVVTPRVSELDNEPAIEPLRARLQDLFLQPLPRQVVVNLEYIAHISGRAIGVLLAHHLHLDRAGGGLRICQARARIMAVLHQVRLTMLVECHPTLDEAVLSAWPGSSKGPSLTE